jgi:hypothetical protein
MKKMLASIFIAAGLLAAPVMAEEAKPETKKVCIKTTDAKTKKEVEKCKVVKIHEKHEGTKVPEKAPKK